MKEKILELRKQGYTYNQISKELGCAKSTVSYYLGTGQIAKAKARAYLNREKNSNRKRKRREFLKEFTRRYKKLCGCKNCGIKNPIVLEFDHLDSSTKISTVSQMISDRYSIETVKEEIRKCQVLCANCHAIKTAKDYNYHGSNKI